VRYYVAVLDFSDCIGWKWQRGSSITFCNYNCHSFIHVSSELCWTRNHGSQ